MCKSTDNLNNWDIESKRGIWYICVQSSFQFLEKIYFRTIFTIAVAAEKKLQYFMFCVVLNNSHIETEMY